MTQETTFNQEQALQKYTELMRLIRVGAYEERQAHHYASGTYPEDGVEQGVATLDKAARRNGLEFAWNPFTSSFDLQAISQEDLDAMEEAEQEPDANYYQPPFNESGEESE